MKIQILYFSGTGNTLLAVREMEHLLKIGGTEVSLLRFDQSAPDQIDRDSTLVFAFPIGVHTAYPFIWNYLTNLPRTQKRVNCYILTTLGGSHSGIIPALRKSLAPQGYDVIAGTEIKMPHNLLPSKVEDQIDHHKRKTGLELVTEFTKSLLAGKLTWERKPYIDDGFTLIANGKWIWDLMRFFYPFRVEPSLCTGCGICVKLCPVKNIVIEGKTARIQSNCQVCMRCISYCPYHAILNGKQKYHTRYQALPLKDIL